MTSSPTDEIPVFAGSAELLILVQDLIRRPARGEAPCLLRGTVHARPGIPILALVDPHEIGVLPAIARRLGRAQPHRVPHSLYSVPDIQGTFDVGHLLTVLDGLRAGLGTELSRSTGRIRFPRYALVRWLIAQDLGEDEVEPDHNLRGRLRERDLARRSWLTSNSEQVTDLGDPKLNLIGRLLLHLPLMLWFRLKVAGRLPGRSGVDFRWLRKQEKYLASDDPGSVLGFAERLCAPRRRTEDLDELLMFVVHTFLEDLRDAYRRRPWRLRTARRMAYAVALLDNISDDNVGRRFLELVNDVRNDTGTFDPLLVVASGTTRPARLASCDPVDPASPAPAKECLLAHRDWVTRLPEDSRRRSPAAWYLAVDLPEPVPLPASGKHSAAASEQPYLDHFRALRRVGPIRIDSAPFWFRRWPVRTVAALLVLALVAPLLAGYLTWQRAESEWRAEHCGLDRSHPDAATLATVKRADRTECIGLSQHGYVFSPETKALAAVQGTIHDQNRQADAAHLANPRRPFVTLAYMQVMTSEDKDDALASEREHLLGAAVAQRRQLNSRTDGEPIFRLVVANAGRDMMHGPEVAQMLTMNPSPRAPVVGVLGLDQSRDPTIRAISELNLLGIPMMATTLSADQLVQVSKMYFQVSPQNIREAAVAAAFADAELTSENSPRRVARRTLLLYSADREDTYSQNLADDVRDEFGRRGFEVIRQPFRPDSVAEDSMDPTPSVTEAGQQQACGFDGVVFFAGRTEDFPTLLESIRQRCQSDPPVILAGDDVSRYAANADLRADNPAEFYYLTFATRSQPCDQQSALYQTMRNLFPHECSPAASSAFDGHAALAYDAALTVLAAVRSIAGDRIPVNPSTVWHGISTIRGDLHYDGESGIVDYGDGRSQAPVDKYIAVMKIDGSLDPLQVASCGRAKGETPSEWCPLDGSQTARTAVDIETR